MKRFEGRHNAEIDEKFHQLDMGNIANVVYWWQFFELIKDVEGDIVECGIGRGRSLLIQSSLNYMLGKLDIMSHRKVFGYDSFEGFPEPTEQDKSVRNPKKGEWSQSPSGKYDYTEDFARLVLSSGGVPDDEVVLTKGFFCDSLKGHPKDRPIALLHLDGDLYQSYKDVLEAVYDQVSIGGVLVFDDFKAEKPDNEPWPGARLAVQEFFGEKMNDFKISIGGTYYYVKK